MNEFFTKELIAKIRAAYNAGQRTVMLPVGKGTEQFSIKLVEHKASFVSGGESKTQTESWLAVAPVSGELTPCGNFELKHEGNMRTVRAKS